ncbi:hypothetical protein [Chryseobacterium chendengshani]|uniref:hypothetical protein n=1 Tax=Chryseobacterium sp. LJ756 TaxID=2864113 RepID=UPI001C63FA39|nr:hypothetical protein [Chryseobacterium sp. LJ756]MBW7676819.1 hypothetical protein [Chryseobacterium sp. LJ756]
MKKIIICAGIIVANNITAQANPNLGSFSNPVENIKQLFPAAPAANSLMKFEEVPVSNYTGIPDIKIPIASLLANNQIAVGVSLNYHPLNAKPDDKAGDVGLGWSLFAGGSITRTVRGTPDDQAVLAAMGGIPTVGIYFDEFTSNYSSKNYTRKYLDAISGVGIDNADLENYRKLFYEAGFLNKYDTDYDLYQYNFMGYTGRFIIKKNSNNELFIDKLDKNNLEISIQSYSPTNTFEATGFIIKDENGNKFLFNVLEKSTRSGLTNRQTFGGDITTNILNYGFTPSAFHLSKISDASNADLVEFDYYPSQQIFYTDNSQINRSKEFIDDAIVLEPVRIQFDKDIPATNETSVISTVTSVRNLQNIRISGKGTINFAYLQGRSDSNYSHPQQLSKLDKIKLIDPSGKTLETYQLSYSSFDFSLLGRDINDRRLALSAVTKYKSNSEKDFDYIFNYTQNTDNAVLGKDHWKWFNCPRPYASSLLAKDTSPNCAKINILESIKLPGGGLRSFDFGSNTYSFDHTGASLNDFEENVENWTYTTTSNVNLQSTFPVNAYHNLGSDSQNRILVVEKSEILNNDGAIGFLYLDKLGTNNQVIQTSGLENIYNKEFILDAGYTYRFKFIWTNTNDQGTANIDFAYKSKSPVQKQWLNGGGIRINSISYFDKPTDALPVKKVNFSYADPNNPGKSSGALVFPKPIHHYEYEYYNDFVYVCGANNNLCKYHYNNNFTIYSSENFIPVQKTQGSDVGYQNVTVSETDKGSVQYTYTSPIDEPNPDYVIGAPFVPVANYDHKRGILTMEQKKDNNNNLLFTNSNQYDIYNTDKLTGISLRNRNSPMTEYLYASIFPTYQAYISTCIYNYNPNYLNSAYCGNSDPITMIAITNNTEIVGKTNLNHSETTEHLNGKTLKTYQDVTFNPRDYPIKQVTTHSDSKITETNYQYAHEKGNTRLINANMIAVPLETSVVEKQNSSDPGKIIGKTETKYDNLAHLFPSSVLSFDFQNTSSTELTYDQYDSRGNLLQYTSKDGIPTAIIWGYNQTQPIAKVSGLPYSVVSSLASAIVAASDLDASNPSNEPALIDALDAFRRHSGLEGAQITTYSYDPLIGVTSITPPSGIREVYLYDLANRLKEIRENDAAGKILKEFKYNYKN